MDREKLLPSFFKNELLGRSLGGDDDKRQIFVEGTYSMQSQPLFSCNTRRLSRLVTDLGD
jgi:hypothetical protein